VVRLVTHVRSNAIAYLALFVSLGGTSYAAARLAPGSVGTVQLHNGAVTAKKIANGAVAPSKLNARAIGGVVRNWAQIDADGTVASSSGRAHVIGAPAQGGYVISWADTFPPTCAVIATPLGSRALGGDSSGYVNAHIAGVHPTSVWLDTYDPQGQPSPAAFSVAVIC
jgi:hypothetical protein